MREWLHLSGRGAMAVQPGFRAAKPPGSFGFPAKLPGAYPVNVLAPLFVGSGVDPGRDRVDGRTVEIWTSSRHLRKRAAIEGCLAA